MIASSSAVIAPGGVLRSVRSGPPLTIRQVRSDDPDVCALCLVGSAAGPLAGDRIELDLRVESGADATVSSAGALLAQGRPGPGSATVRTRAHVGADARLVSRCEPLVVCAGSSIAVSVQVELADTARLVWREVVVLGRAGEPPGSVTLDWDVRVGGRPLLRQRTDLTAGTLWAGLLGGARVLASELQVGPGLVRHPVVRSARSVAQPIGEGSVLLTVVADDAATALAELDHLAATVTSDDRSHLVGE